MSNIPGVGVSPYLDTSVSNTVEAVSTIQCRVFWINAENTGGTKAYLQLFDATVASTTLGASTPTLSIPIPANSIWDIALPVPIGFTTALSVAFTATATGSGAPAGACVLNLAKLGF